MTTAMCCITSLRTNTITSKPYNEEHTLIVRGGIVMVRNSPDTQQ
jgi:hypothetical protein